MYKILIFLLICLNCYSQQNCHVDSSIVLKDDKFQEFLEKRLSFSIPVISVEELKNIKDSVILLDARSSEAFDVSHIPGARRIGFEDFSIEKVWNIDRDSEIVVYCTTGIQSEKVGTYLKNIGFTNVRNLYGSIIEWSNSKGELVDSTGKRTKEILIKENFKEKKEFLQRGKAVKK